MTDKMIEKFGGSQKAANAFSRVHWDLFNTVLLRLDAPVDEITIVSRALKAKQRETTFTPRVLAASSDFTIKNLLGDINYRDLGPKRIDLINQTFEGVLKANEEKRLKKLSKKTS